MLLCDACRGGDLQTQRHHVADIIGITRTSDLAQEMTTEVRPSPAYSTILLKESVASADILLLIEFAKQLTAM